MAAAFQMQMKKKKKKKKHPVIVIIPQTRPIGRIQVCEAGILLQNVQQIGTSLFQRLATVLAHPFVETSKISMAS